MIKTIIMVHKQKKKQVSFISLSAYLLYNTIIIFIDLLH